jgi:CubicO group peptidase (beta-lactamase class C family)
MKKAAFILLALAAAGASPARGGARFGTLGAVEAAEEVLDRTPSPAACTDQQLAAIESSMSATLDASALTDFTVLLEAADGRTYSHSKGASSGSTRYESASTSKWVASTVILSLVDRGYLTLDSAAPDLIPWWTSSAANPISRVTLRSLLSFTSGVSTAPAAEMGFCLALNTFEGCVQNIYALNVGNNIEPGSQFFYSSSHLQVAGLMAVNARSALDVNYSSWSAVFNEFKSLTALFPNSDFDVPFSSNPRLAGGMTWTGEDYMGFLRALYRGQLLSPALRAQLFADQRGSAAVMASPLLLAPPVGMGEDWRYGLGNWVECEAGTSCTTAGRNSSPGAYGAYPFIDFREGYFGIVARRDVVGSFPEGIDLFRSVQDAAERWASKACGG